MSSKKELKFEIIIPQNKTINENLEEAKENRIKQLKNDVKQQYDEMYRNQEVKITEENKKTIEDLIFATKDLIDNCIEDSKYSGNKDANFLSLTYLYQRLSLRLETYKLDEKIEQVNKKIVETNTVQNDIINKQNKMEEQSNNLVYNLLGFLTAFSIVSAVVGVVSNIKGTINIMIFMTFTIFILLTTLIGLHNFYKNNNEKKTKLQDNYFLWKVTGIILICLVLILGFRYVNNNKEKIFNYLDKKIENVIEKKVTEQFNKELAN